MGWGAWGSFLVRESRERLGGSWPCCWQGALPRSVPLSFLNTPLIPALLGLHRGAPQCLQGRVYLRLVYFRSAHLFGYISYHVLLPCLWAFFSDAGAVPLPLAELIPSSTFLPEAVPGQDWLQQYLCYDAAVWCVSVGRHPSPWAVLFQMDFLPSVKSLGC